MLRFHFEGSDYGKVVLGRPNPMWELTLSLHVLANGSGRPALQMWRRGASRKLMAMGLACDVRQLMELAPEAPYFPDFLTPDAISLESGLRELASTPAPVLRDDLERLAEVGPVPAVASGLAATGSMDRLVATMQAYYDAVVGPAWRHVAEASKRDRQWRSAVLESRGTLAVLASFDPAVMNFSEPVLRIRSPEGDVHLAGQGLALVPSYFCRQAPISNRRCDGRPHIVYQAGLGGCSIDSSEDSVEEGLRAGEPADSALDKLLGANRRAVLAALRDPASTTSLAASLGLAASTVSAHLSVLYAAGLVSKRRHEHEVLYWLTPGGQALIGRRGAGL